MTNEPTFGALGAALGGVFAARMRKYTMETTPGFLDFLWDEDLTFEEIRELEPGVTVHAVAGGRQIVLQRIRGTIRYWLATESDPIALNNAWETELGVVDSVVDAADLCDEFLDTATRIGELRTRREKRRNLARFNGQR